MKKPRMVPSLGGPSATVRAPMPRSREAPASHLREVPVMADDEVMVVSPLLPPAAALAPAPASTRSLISPALASVLSLVEARHPSLPT